jgi:hypothetical protein
MKGVSSQLLQFMCNKYKDLTLTLWCEHHLKDVYEKHNFKIIERTPTIYIMQKVKN